MLSPKNNTFHKFQLQIAEISRHYVIFLSLVFIYGFYQVVYSISFIWQNREKKCKYFNHPAVLFIIIQGIWFLLSCKIICRVVFIILQTFYLNIYLIFSHFSYTLHIFLYFVSYFKSYFLIFYQNKNRKVHSHFHKLHTVNLYDRNLFRKGL